MPSDRRRSRSLSRSQSPPRRSEKRRDYSDDEDRSSRRAGRSDMDRRRGNDDDYERRRRSRYDNDDDDDRKDRKSSRRDDRGRGRSESRSRSPPRRREHRGDRDRYRDSYDDDDRRRDGGRSNNAGRSGGALPSQSSALAAAGVPEGKKFGNNKRRQSSRSPSPSAEAIEASKPNFANSGALAAETNTSKGVVLKYNEPPEARKPNKGWRLYVFKGKEQVDLIHVNRQSAYLFGRDKVVVDIPIEHPSASKQHAVLQYRQVHERNEFGDSKSVTKPYLIDLDSANGTTVNDEKIPPSRYYELQPNDLIKFAYSTREYVLIVD